MFVNIGYGNMVAAERVVSIVSPDSMPIKRVIADARDRSQLIDATSGRRTRSVITTDAGYVVLSSVLSDTIANRFSEEALAEGHR